MWSNKFLSLCNFVGLLLARKNAPVKHIRYISPTEAVVKKQFNQFMFLIVILITSIIICSCSPGDLYQEIDLAAGNNSVGAEALNQGGSNSNATGLITNSKQPSLEDMMLFEGSVFVASTKPITSRWQIAGWKIANIANTIDGDKAPQDCTLYPHQGVEDQWIGSCSGPTFIPTDGANHIAVMHTRPDGSTTLVQVAPASD